jgi:hypothetical protein
MCGYVIREVNCRNLFYCIPDTHSYRIASTKRHINRVVPPVDGHIVVRKKKCREKK